MRGGPEQLGAAPGHGWGGQQELGSCRRAGSSPKGSGICWGMGKAPAWRWGALQGSEGTDLGILCLLQVTKQSHRDTAPPRALGTSLGIPVLWGHPQHPSQWIPPFIPVDPPIHPSGSHPSIPVDPHHSS